jgi:3-oxoadipate enol-lactonase
MDGTVRATVGDVDLAYETHGLGEPVLFVHAGVFADWFLPLVREPALADRYQLVSYHRVNYGRSTHLDRVFSVEEQAAHARGLLERLGIERAHVVGHSAGASIALQLALDAPEAVYSLAVLDPAIASSPADGPAKLPAFIIRALEEHEAGDTAWAVDTFMSGVAGREYRAMIEARLPTGAFEQAVADAHYLFRHELPALWDWSFTRKEASQIQQPTLVVAGALSGPIFEQRQRTLCSWLPNAEAFTLPMAGHLLQAEQPRAMAAALAAFLARHPMAA